MKPSLAVIGTIFIDYKGFAPAGYNGQGRNLGRIEVVPGGVARNVAVNVAHLGVDTRFVGTLNDDGVGETLKKTMQKSGINLDYLCVVPEGGTGAWLVILDNDGNLLGSVSQMPDINVMEKEITAVLAKSLQNVQGVALDIDLSETLVRNIMNEAKNTGSKIYALPGNFSVIGKHYDLFKDIECFICNEVEAEILLGKQNYEKPEEVLINAQKFAKQYGLNNFVITMGSKGSLYIDNEGNTGFQEIYPTKVVDSTGAGDAFFSGTVAALLHKKTLAQAVEVGSKIASAVISATESDCSSLEEQVIKQHNFDWFQ